MARTPIVPQALPGSWSITGVAATNQAADTSLYNSFKPSGKDVVIAFNSGASPYTVTITSTPDDKGRTGDAGPVTLAAGEIRVFGLLPMLGWQQTDGTVYLQASNAAVKFSIFQL